MLFSKAVTSLDRDSIGAVDATRDYPRLSNGESVFIENLKAGDASAYETLVERYSGDIYALTFRLTSDANEAADLTQDTFVRAFRKVGSFRGDASLKTWLFRIAINESRNRFRWWKRRRRDVTVSLDASIGDTDMQFSDTIADDGISPEDEAIRLERETQITTALGTMKPAFREAVVLADIEGLTYEECAAAIGTNIGTIKSRLSRGRDELRRKLKDL